MVVLKPMETLETVPGYFHKCDCPASRRAECKTCRGYGVYWREGRPSKEATNINVRSVMEAMISSAVPPTLNWDNVQEKLGSGVTIPESTKSALSQFKSKVNATLKASFINTITHLMQELQDESPEGTVMVYANRD